MVANYTLSDGKKISIFMWDDIYEGDIWRKYVEVSIGNRSSREIKKTMYKDKTDGRIYFCWNGERVYVNDFDYMTVDELIAKMKTEDFISEDDFLATLLKDTDNVGFYAELAVIDMLIPMFGMSVSSGKYQKCFCVPVETAQFSKKDWHYKVNISPYMKALALTCQSHDYYLSDLWSLINSGDINLVNKAKILETEHMNAIQKGDEILSNNLLKDI